MTRLVTLSGRAPAVNPTELTNFDAAIWFLAQLDRAVPGITWRDIARAKKARMGGGLLDDIGSALSSGGDFIGRQFNNFTDFTGDVIDGIADKSGDIIRLAADEEVREGISQYAAAIGTGGTSEVAKGTLEQFASVFSGGKSDRDPGVMQKILGFFDQLGGNVKREFDTQVASPGTQTAMETRQLLMIGGVGIFALMMINSMIASGRR